MAGSRKPGSYDSPMDADHERNKGLLAAVFAFGLWGVIPVYWKAVTAIPPLEMIGLRVVWGLPFLALLVFGAKGLGAVRAAVRQPRVIASLLLSAALLAFNWFVFIRAMVDGQVLQTSLGYYINPIVNVLLGWLLLGEKLTRTQWLAVALTAAGVVNLVIEVGELPWVALLLAFSFAFYGLVKKTVRVDALPGLFLEVVLLLPLAIVLLVVLHSRGTAALPIVGSRVQWLVPIAGLLTAVPLWLFAYGARRLRLATVGLIQFLAPTGQFLLAVLLFGEPFTFGHAVTFVLIWAGVALYLTDLARTRRSPRARVQVVTVPPVE